MSAVICTPYGRCAKSDTLCTSQGPGNAVKTLHLNSDGHIIWHRPAVRQGPDNCFSRRPSRDLTTQLKCVVDKGAFKASKLRRCYWHSASVNFSSVMGEAGAYPSVPRKPARWISRCPTWGFRGHVANEQPLIRYNTALLKRSAACLHTALGIPKTWTMQRQLNLCTRRSRYL